MPRLWTWLPFFLLPLHVLAQSYLATALKKGPFEVGFKAGIHYDLGRPPLKEQFARYSQGRAVHLSVWYPAVLKSNHPRMLYGEYVDELARMVNPREVTKRTRRESIQSINAFIMHAGGDTTLFLQQLGALFNSETNAFRNASPRDGPFPILIYPETLYLNSILCEYLASHGYIVVSVAKHGTLAKLFDSGSVMGIETLIQDCQFALSVVKREFGISRHPMAVLGTGTSGSAAIAWMMRSPEIDVAVNLDGSMLKACEYERIRQTPYFDSTKVAKPILVIYSSRAAIDADLMSQYPFADRYFLALHQFHEKCYTNFGVLEKRIPGILGAGHADTIEGYTWMARYTLYFLDWHLGGGIHGKTFFERSPEAHGLSASFFHKPALDTAE